MNPTSSPLVFVHHWRAFGYALRIARIALVLMIAVWALLLSAQGRDILVNLAERGSFSSQIFFLAVFYWAFSIWYWTRALLNVRFADPPLAMATFNFWRKHLPRWLGAMAFVAVGSALAVTWAGAPPSGRPGLLVLMIGALAWGSLFLLLVIYRRGAARGTARWLQARMGAPGHGGRLRKALARGLDVSRFDVDEQDTRSAPHLWGALREFAPTFGAFTALFGLLLFFWAWASPGTLGTTFGAVTLFMIWGGSWLPVGSTLTWLGDRYGFPVLSVLLAAAFAFSVSNDNHEIRVMADGADPASRKSVDEALDDWRKAHAGNANGEPFVVVATAGGGIRAAYWTATVLGELNDCIAGFNDKLFAVSGVSGGAVGATVYRNVSAGSARAPVCKDRDSGAPLRGARACSQEVLEGDFLGPAVAALLYPDILQRFLPGVWLPDRAAALEKSWEFAYEQVMNEKRLSRSLVRLDELDGRSWPALFLNATWSENGRRIVASNLKLQAPDFPLAVDQLGELGRDLRLSTAAHNSARFTGVSPPGMWKNTTGEIAGHLVDGGYFENYGAEAATSVLRAATAKMVNTDTAIKPLAILISSDPGLPMPPTDVRAATPIGFGYEVRGILSALLNTRNARGIEAATRLQAAVPSAQQDFAYFRMCEADHQAEPPLGWTLSAAARAAINAYLPVNGKAAACDNDVALRKVLAAFEQTQCGPR